MHQWQWHVGKQNLKAQILQYLDKQLKFWERRSSIRKDVASLH